jgi:Zn finger protein HypA/HybF involved in hydrogenase expression
MILTQYELSQCEEAMMDGTCEGECAECGHTQTVEPDGDYPCPECKEGRIQSVLVKYGMI